MSDWSSDEITSIAGVHPVLWCGRTPALGGVLDTGIGFPGEAIGKSHRGAVRMRKDWRLEGTQKGDP
jgi:hypothetical protein